jgi:uncharacterized protein YajQ (UPF0234 family)
MSLYLLCLALFCVGLYGLLRKRNIVKMIKDKKLKVQAAIQDGQVRVTGKKIDDLQEVIQMLRGAKIEIPLQFVNMQGR